MSFKRVVSPVLVAALLAPTSVWAQMGGFGVGCSNLPEYARAAGALEGLSSCDMSVEEARRIIAAHDGTVAQPAAPPPVRHRRHKVRPPRP